MRLHRKNTESKLADIALGQLKDRDRIRLVLRFVAQDLKPDLVENAGFCLGTGLGYSEAMALNPFRQGSPLAAIYRKGSYLATSKPSTVIEDPLRPSTALIAEALQEQFPHRHVAVRSDQTEVWPKVVRGCSVAVEEEREPVLLSGVVASLITLAAVATLAWPF